MTRAPLSKLPNAPAVKKTIKKVSEKKNKTADGSTRPPKKKLARRVTDATATKAPASSFVPPTANSHDVFDGMPKSFNYETYMTTMGVGSHNSHWSQTNDVHLDDHEFGVDEDGEGIVDAPKGRVGNYIMDEDVLLYNTWSKVSRDATDDEKWRPREGVDEERNKHERTIDLEDDEEESSSDDGKRSPTPNSVVYSKPNRPSGGKKDGKEKKKRKGDDELKNAIEAIVNARKEANEVRKMERNQDVAAEERRLTIEERRVAAEERKVALKEKKLAMKGRTRLLEWEKYLFFIMDTSTLNEQQKEYVKLGREQVLIQQQGMAIGGMGATMGGMGATMGGMGGMEGMDGFRSIMGGMIGKGVFGATMGDMGSMSFVSLIRGMGAPPDGHMSSDVPPHIPSHDVVEDLANTYRAPHDDAACVNDEEEEEEESSSDEDEETEEEGDEDEA
ncbi:Alternative oxidase 1a, mitochondrial [Hordeum vulgare]|nr:Alternative oxidase 1a, mitochondrial [Hordeum vulgare]